MGVALGATTRMSWRGAAVQRPPVPNSYQDSDWSDPGALSQEGRGDVIEWSGVRVSNTALQQDVIDEEPAFEGMPLWKLYAWRLNQRRIPSQSQSDGDDGGLLSGVGISAPLGPLAVTADLGEVGETVRNKFSESGDFIAETATSIFADQIESDYPFVEEVDICDGLRKDSVLGCYADELSYSTSSGTIRNKFTFEVEHSVEVEWALDHNVTYRGLLVTQTYDTDVVSDLNKTFVVTAAVYPEIRRIDALGEYDFIQDSRRFMKNVR